jgi:hypothetical protein
LVSRSPRTSVGRAPMWVWDRNDISVAVVEFVEHDDESGEHRD